MARLVDPLATERPIPQPDARLHANIIPISSAGPVDPGPGFRALGHSLEQGSNEIYHAQKIEEERINTMAAEDAFNKLRMTQLDLSTGDSGFMKKKGAAAVNFPIYNEWSGRFDAARDQIGATLTNDRQREKYKARADLSGLQFREEILRHVGQESDVYAKEVYDGTMAVELRQAVARWNSPADIGLSLDRVKHAVDERAERYSWDAGFTDGVMKEELGKMHAAVIGQAIGSGNYKYAKEWYDQHKGEVDPGTGKAIEIAVRDGTQKELYNGYNADFLASRNSVQGLESLLGRVGKDKVLDEGRQNTITGRIEYRVDVLNRKAEMAQAHAEKELGRAIDTLNSMTMASFPPTEEQMAPVVAAAKGTSLEAEAARMASLAVATNKFRLAAPAERAAYLQELEAQTRKDPTKFDVRLLPAFRSIDENLRRDMNHDPVGTAIRQNLYEPAKPLDLTKPAEIGPQLREQAAVAQSMSEKNQVPFKPLTAAQAGVLTSVLKDAPPSEKGKYFGDLSNSAGDDPAGRNTYHAIMGQLAPDDPVTAKAGEYAGKGRTMASTLMLQGQAILNPVRKEDGKPDHGKIWPMPPDAKLAVGFDEYVGNAYAGKPQLRNVDFQAAKAIYAKMIVDKPESGDGQNLRDDLWTEAMKMATGGIHPNYNGAATILPYNYDKGEFRDGVSVRVQAIIGRSRTITGDLNPPLPPPTERGYANDLGEPAALGDAPYRQMQEEWASATPKQRERMVDPTAPGAKPWQARVFAKIGETYVPPKTIPADLTGALDHRVTRDVLMDLPLERLDDGVYAFRSGDKILVDRANKPILLNFNVQPEPTGPPVVDVQHEIVPNRPRPSEDVR